jgi:hypothetical protein
MNRPKYFEGYAPFLRRNAAVDSSPAFMVFENYMCTSPGFTVLEK